MADFCLKNTRYLPISQVLILIFGTITCLIISYSRGDVTLYVPFISETGAYSPEKCLFSLTLITGSFLGFIIYLLYFIILKQNPLSEQKFLKILNITSLAIGCVAMFGLAGVAAFPMTTVFWAHLLFAGAYFVGSAAYFTVISFITYKIEGKSRMFYYRASLSGVITIFLILIVIFFPLSLVTWHKHNDFIPALKTPDNKGFSLLIISSLLEWSIVIVIILFSLSFINELNKFSFFIRATSDKNLPVDDDATPAPN